VERLHLRGESVGSTTMTDALGLRRIIALRSSTRNTRLCAPSARPPAPQPTTALRLGCRREKPFLRVEFLDDGRVYHLLGRVAPVVQSHHCSTENLAWFHGRVVSARASETHIPHGWMNNAYVPRPMGLANGGHSTFGGYYRTIRPEGPGNPYGIGPGRNWKKAGGLGGEILWAAGPDQTLLPDEAETKQGKGPVPRRTPAPRYARPRYPKLVYLGALHSACERASPCAPSDTPGFVPETGAPIRPPVLSKPGFAPPCGVPTALVLFAHSPAGVGPSPMARAGNAATDSISAEATPPATTRLTLLNSSSLSRRRQQGLGRPRCMYGIYAALVQPVHPSPKGPGLPARIPSPRSVRSGWAGGLTSSSRMNAPAAQKNPH